MRQTPPVSQIFYLRKIVVRFARPPISRPSCFVLHFFIIPFLSAASCGFSHKDTFCVIDPLLYLNNHHTNFSRKI